MVSEREIEAAREAWREYWSDVIGQYEDNKGPMEGMRRALEAAACVRAEANAGGPVAWGEDIDGKIVSVRLDKSRHCTVPLYPAPQPSGPVKVKPQTVDELFPHCDHWGAKEWFQRLVNAVHSRDDAVRSGDEIAFQTHNNIASSTASRLVHDFAAVILSALTAGKPEQAVPSEAELFDRADWYWRTMDPDDSGDSPEEAINRLGNFVVCEIASSFTGPTRYGFTAPVLDPDSDDTEFLHFPTQEEAIEAAKQRAAMLFAAPAAPTAGGGDAE